MSAPETPLLLKARLTNVGNGFIEVSSDAIRFYVETGRLKKRRKISSEIPLNEVESIERQENDAILLSKKSTSVFAFEQASQAETVIEKIALFLKEQKKEQENEETANLLQNEFVEITTNSLEIADLLFRILKSLDGEVDWKLVETLLNDTIEKAAKLSGPSLNSICLNTVPLSTAVQQYSPRETAEKAFDILDSLYEHFNRLNQISGGHIGLNQHVPKLAIQTIYLLNDMALGAVVGDENVGKERDELLSVLNELAEIPGSKIDAAAVKSSLDKLSEGEQKQKEVAEEIKLVLVQQLKELISWTKQSTFDPKA